MHEEKLKALLKSFKSEELTEEDVVSRLRTLPFEDLEFAKVDHHRRLRQGFPEVVFGQGKTPEQVLQIALSFMGTGNNLLITRTNEETYQHILPKIPDVVFHAEARCITRKITHDKQCRGKLLILTAGTADIPVAKEAFVTAEIMGNDVETIFDIGVAGLHRLFSVKDKLEQSTVIIVVAGMEGALPSVVGGLVAKPVIAVPTSTGYGTSFGGVTALLGMLNSCASGVCVVNIDNGFGAAYVASLINANHTY